MPDRDRSAFGGILVTIGTVLFILAIVSSAAGLQLGPISRILQEYIFIPLIMIFAGRSMIRRARRQTPTVAGGEQPERRNRLEDFQRWAEEQLEGPRPQTPQTQSQQSQTPQPTPPQPRNVERKREAPRPTMSDPPPPLYVPPVKPEGFVPKTSEEMIADAKRRIQSKG